MAKCVGCPKRMRKVVIDGQEVQPICASCKREMKEAEKLTASCPHPATRRLPGTEMRACVSCGAIKGGSWRGKDEWEPPMRRPKIRRVV